MNNMNKKNIRARIFLLLVIAVLLGFLGYILSFPETFGLGSRLCDWYSFGGELRCSSTSDRAIGRPLYWGMPYLAGVFVFILLLPKTYKRWWKFARVYLPIAVIGVWLSPTTGGIMQFARDFTALRLGQLFLIVSIFIIAYDWWKRHGQENANSDTES